MTAVSNDVVPTAEGEVVDEVMTKADAIKLDKRIRTMADTVASHWQGLVRLVEDAKAGQIHVALGYESWTAYLADAVQKPLRALGDRPAVVAMLSNKGMSNRGIAEVVGVSDMTVGRDLAQVQHDVAPAPKIGRDGKVQRPKSTAADAAPPKERKSPRAPFGRDIAICRSDIQEISNLVNRAVRRLETLKEDDRYPKYREEVETSIRNMYERLGYDLDRLFPCDAVDAEFVDVAVSESDRLTEEQHIRLRELTARESSDDEFLSDEEYAELTELREASAKVETP